MKELNKNWLTEGLIDFEYKKYLLLAYLQEVKQNFNGKKLYPFLSDLLFHYNNLMSVKEKKKLLHENFPKQISKADFEKLQLIYEEILGDDAFMQVIEDILEYSIPKIKESLSDGKTIYEEVEDSITITPVGLSPLYLDAGYLLFYLSRQNETRIYEYSVTIFENSEEKFRGVHTRFVESLSRSVFQTFESVKLDLIRKYKSLPNPATFLVNSKLTYPFDETLLPITKRLLVKRISQAEA